MARKITGISRELIIHPGETLGDILEERGITQAELAARTGVSPAYVCNVISGKKDISANFAFALEYALGIPKSFWINLQANYDAELLEVTAQDTITEEERAARSRLKDVVKYLRETGKMAPGETKNRKKNTAKRSARSCLRKTMTQKERTGLEPQTAGSGAEALTGEPLRLLQETAAMIRSIQKKAPEREER